MIALTQMYAVIMAAPKRNTTGISEKQRKFVSRLNDHPFSGCLVLVFSL